MSSKDGIGISRLTSRLEEGAVVYVDDFAASGKQFVDARRQVGPCLVGNFPEFFLLPCICEEAQARVQACGVEVRVEHIHTLQERPLLDSCGLLDSRPRERLVHLCKLVSPYAGLGWGGLATMVVYQWNCPNTTPLVLRGSKGQYPYKGVLPRVKDLPVASHALHAQESPPS